jgi:hypothetical protein
MRAELKVGEQVSVHTNERGQVIVPEGSARKAPPERHNHDDQVSFTKGVAHGYQNIALVINL